MRVALITDAYPPMRSSAAVQMRDLAREFAAQGHEPVVLVPDEGLGAAWALEEDQGVQVLRLRAFATRDLAYIRRVVNEFLLPWMMRRALRRSPFGATQWDGVVWYSPSIFFGPLVRTLKRASGCRSYMILRDLFPDWAVDLGLMRRGTAYRILKRVERQQHEAADIVGVQSPSTSTQLGPLADDPERQVEVLWNWLSPSGPGRCSIDVSASRLAGRVIFVYAGNMGVAQGLDTLLELATALEARTNIGFLFVGRGSEVPRLRREAAMRELTNVLFHDEVEPDEIPGLLAQCHVGLLALDPRHRTHNIPGKFLTYVQAGLPVLARINANNDLVGLIEQEGVGRVETGNSPDSLRRLAESMADDADWRAAMASRGRELAERLFSPRTAVAQILKGLGGAR